MTLTIEFSLDVCYFALNSTRSTRNPYTHFQGLIHFMKDATARTEAKVEGRFQVHPSERILISLLLMSLSFSN